MSERELTWFETQAAMVCDFYDAGEIDAETAVQILREATARPAHECALAIAQEYKDRRWVEEWHLLKRGDDGKWTQ